MWSTKIWFKIKYVYNIIYYHCCSETASLMKHIFVVRYHFILNFIYLVHERRYLRFVQWQNVEIKNEIPIDIVLYNFYPKYKTQSYLHFPVKCMFQQDLKILKLFQRQVHKKFSRIFQKQNYKLTSYLLTSYIYTHTHTHTHTYIYIYIYISGAISQVSYQIPLKSAVFLLTLAVLDNREILLMMIK